MRAIEPIHAYNSHAYNSQNGAESVPLALKRYGIDHFGPLRAVLVHRPTRALALVNAESAASYLFDAAPDVDRYLAEHDRYTRTLSSFGVKVHHLEDYVVENRALLDQLPNLAYMHDTAVVTRHGAIISKMAFPGRQREERVVAEALRNLGVPTLFAAADDEEFEGCLALSAQTLLVARTERFNRAGVERFIPTALQRFDEVIYVDIPQARRFMHPDMIFNRASERVALAYLPAFLEVHRYTRLGCEVIPRFRDLMAARGIEIVEVSDAEQERWGCSFVPLAPGLIMNYDLSLTERTLARLSLLGVRTVPFHPDALLAGGGSLRCLTMRLWRGGN